MREEEIDLRKLYTQFQQTAIYQKLEKVVSFIFRYNFWFVIFILLGATAGYLYRSSIPPEYKAKITTSSDVLDPKVIQELMPQLNSSINHQDIEIIYSNQNNLILVEKDPLIININSNEFYNFKKMNAEEVFLFEVRMKDTVSYHTIANDFINFFESIPYYASIKKSNQQTLLEKQEILINEIDYIDSLLKGGMLNDQSALIAEKTKARKHLVDINKQIENSNIININTQSSPKEIPHPSHSYIIILFALTFFIIGGIILWIIKH